MVWNLLISDQWVVAKRLQSNCICFQSRSKFCTNWHRTMFLNKQISWNLVDQLATICSCPYVLTLTLIQNMLSTIRWMLSMEKYSLPASLQPQSLSQAQPQPASSQQQMTWCWISRGQVYLLSLSQMSIIHRPWSIGKCLDNNYSTFQLANYWYPMIHFHSIQ